ncbi:hypothetical protein [Enterococcus sp.]|nr:hypothetical protein [Enterococcus sp.]MDU5336160.1 hypothetical protein [Enterococcus sp.]
MKLEYQKTQVSYGKYRPARVVWITRVNGQRVVKSNLLEFEDRDD